MGNFIIKSQKSLINRTDDKIDFYNDLIKNSQTEKCNVLFKQAETFCNKECHKTFEICDEIIAINPQYFQAFLKKIKCQKRTDHDIQLKQCEELLEKFPKNSTKIKLTKVVILLKSKTRKEDLDPLIEELSSLSEKDIEEHYDDLAYGYFYLKMYKKSIEYFTKYISKDPKKEIRYYTRGVVYEHDGQFENALSDYKVSVDLLESDMKDVSESTLNERKENLNRMKNKLIRLNNNLPF